MHSASVDDDPVNMLWLVEALVEVHCVAVCVCVYVCLCDAGAVYTGLGDGRVIRIVDGLVENVTQFGLGGYAALCSKCVCM